MRLRQISLPTRLLLLVGVALLPLVVLAVAGLTLLGRQQQLQVQDGLVERARALRSAVDQELASSVAALKILALSESLTSGDLKRFHAQSQAAITARPDWDGLILLDTAGRRLLNSRTPWGAPIAGGSQPVEPQSLELMLQTRQPLIGNIARGPGGQFRFAVRVPVMRSGEMRYILTALVTPDLLRAVLMQQNMPAETVSTIIDAKSVVVARSRNHEQFLGQPVSESLARRMGRQLEGIGESTTLDGQAVYSAFSRSAASGWGVALGVPVTVVEGPLLRSSLFSAAGFVLSVALALLAAGWMSRRIAGRVAQLREAAQALGRGATPELPEPGMPEVDEVAAALAEADAQLRATQARLRQLNASLEDKVSERTRELQAANADLQAANKELEAFSYTVSHDLRAPVRAVDGFSSLLEKQTAGMLPPEAQRYLGLVRASSRLMGRLIDDLLNFARLGKQKITRHPVDVRAMVEECIEGLRIEYAGRSVECVLGELPVCEADPMLLRQVLSNLIGNAFKYTGTVAQARIEIGSIRQDGQTVFHVRDNGIGFDMKYVHKLFGVFQRLHASDEFEGTGVGLAIVHRIVERHGGRVWVEAVPEKGATFYFTMGEA